MSSYASHLPEELSFNNVVGLGMNEAELSNNPQLADFVIQDLGQNYILPFDDNSFDACVITVSVQYLVKPIDVFQEIARVLRPDCPCIVSFQIGVFQPRQLPYGSSYQTLGIPNSLVTTLPRQVDTNPVKSTMFLPTVIPQTHYLSFVQIQRKFN